MAKKAGRSFKSMVKRTTRSKPAPSELPIASAAWWKARKATRKPGR